MINRRDFLSVSMTGAAAGVASGWLPALAARAAEAGEKPKSCIVLWMAGGPSHLDTFDMKPDAPAEVRGPLKPIPTSVTGIQVSELFPRFAKQMQDAAIIRSMSTPEFDHRRGSYHLHTGYRRGTAGLDYPSLGAIVSSQLGSLESAMPDNVVVGNRVGSGRSYHGQGPGFLGPQYRPLEVLNPDRGVENLKSRQDANRFNDQVDLLAEVEQAFYKNYKAQAGTAHATTVKRAVRLMNAKEARAFDLSAEPAAGREPYGASKFGQGCLLARRLVETGVRFIEVSYGGWDHHGSIYKGKEPIQPMCGVVDQGMSALINDLKTRGLLDSTLVVWMGEFGRTPKLNNKGGGGRDHYSKAWSTVLAGGGIKGGQVIGRTDHTGAKVEERPVSVVDFFATVCTILGINYKRSHRVKPGGRPIDIVENKNPKPIAELL